MNIKQISQEIHQTASEKGFWDNERNVGELLMLVTSELAEALEADRKGKFANINLFDNESQASLSKSIYDWSMVKYLEKDSHWMPLPNKPPHK